MQNQVRKVQDSTNQIKLETENGNNARIEKKALRVIVESIIEKLPIVLLTAVLSIVLIKLINSMNISNTIVYQFDQQIPNRNAITPAAIDVQAVKDITTSAISNIYNILVVSTIFFTLVVATITIFQYTKIKDIDKLKDSLNEENEKVKMLILDLNNKITEIENDSRTNNETYGNKIKDIDIIKKEMNHKANKIEIDLLIMKGKNAYVRNQANKLNINIECHSRILEIYSNDPGIIDDDNLSVVYNEIGYAYLTIDAAKAEDFLLKSLAIQKSSSERAITYINLAEGCINQNKNDKAIEYLETGLKENEANTQLIISLVKRLNLRNKNNDIDEAFELIEQRLVKCCNNYKNILRDVINKNSIGNVYSKYKNEIDKIIN